MFEGSTSIVRVKHVNLGKWALVAAVVSMAWINSASASLIDVTTDLTPPLGSSTFDLGLHKLVGESTNNSINIGLTPYGIAPVGSSFHLEAVFSDNSFTPGSFVSGHVTIKGDVLGYGASGVETLVDGDLSGFTYDGGGTVGVFHFDGVGSPGNYIVGNYHVEYTQFWDDSSAYADTTGSTVPEPASVGAWILFGLGAIVTRRFRAGTHR